MTADEKTLPVRPTAATVRKLQREAEKRNEGMEGGAVWRALDFLLYLCMVVLIMFAVRSVLLDPVRVDGRSMLDTLNDGDVMLVNRTAYTLKRPQRGDIVMCYYPDEYYTEQGLAYASRVKRVVAVGGDTIETRGGELYVNGEKVDEPYLNPDRVGSQEIPLLTVPENSVYVLGDNRSVSRDSRFASVGPIPLSHVVGKAGIRIVTAPEFPFLKLHLIGS